MGSIAKLYRKYTPIALRNYLGEVRMRKMEKFCFDKVKSGKWMADYKLESEYMIKQGRLMTFPYPWVSEYQAKNIQVLYDKDNSMPYVETKNGKLYFPSRYPKRYIQKYFNSILIEQDIRSTHFYFEPDSKELKNSIFFDVGGAEGFVSLMVAPYVSKLLIFECDADWIKALETTFEPWKEKTKIINKFASSKTNKNEMRLDEMKGDYQKIVLKIDVEGMEMEVLNGAEGLLKLDDTRVYVCSYHKKNDEYMLSDLLKKYGFEIEKSDGYMFYGQWEDAGFRKGVIRAKKRI